MPDALITSQPTPWARRARTAGRAVAGGLLLGLHLAVAAVVLAVRVASAVLGLLAQGAAYVELYLSSRTRRPALGQAAGTALAAAFAEEFRTAYRQPTR